MVIEGNNCIFSFIKYISPTWYFLHSTKSDKSYFVDYASLANDEKAVIEFDVNYSSLQSSKLDAAYQAFQKGIIKSDQRAFISEEMLPTIADNYRFVKKYFHPFWVIYILMIRILGFKNPFVEIYAAIKTYNVSRVNLFQNVYVNQDYDNFNSKIINTHPKVSVIIPTLNRYKYLKDVLTDLENQSYKNFEVVVYDQSTPFDKEFYIGWKLDLKVVNQQEKALWLARNSALQQSTGDYILLYDDDSLVGPDWIENHLKCLDFFNADISSGVSLSVVGAKIPNHYRFFRWSDQVDTGNVMIRKEVFFTTGLFDRQFEKQRQGDGEWGMRAYLAGFKNVSNPYSKRVHLKVSDGGLREMGSWDAFRPKKLLASRPVPSVLYLTRKYFGNKAAWYNILINVPPSIIPYKYKRNKFIAVFGIFFSLCMFPIVVYTVLKSWSISSRMLKEGAKIPSLKSI
jgi:glycosyltransferase involved in cell wall biosynthesis